MNMMLITWAMIVFGGFLTMIRIEMIARFRLEAKMCLTSMRCSNQEFLHEYDKYFNFLPWERPYGDSWMVFDLRKWKFEHFYPELAKVLADSSVVD